MSWLVLPLIPSGGCCVSPKECICFLFFLSLSESNELQPRAFLKRGPQNNASLPPHAPSLHPSRFFMMKWPLGGKKKKAAQIEFPGSSPPLHWSRPPPRETPHISITRTPTRRVYRRTQPIYKLKRRYLPESEPRNGISIPPLGSQLRGIKRAPPPPAPGRLDQLRL